MVYYCGREHQVQDWRKHKDSCGKSKAERHDQSESRTSDGGNSKNQNELHKETDHSTKSDDNIDFDDRPFKNEIYFNAPDPIDADSLGKNVLKGLTSNKYFVVDGVFKKSHLHSVLHEIDTLEEKSSFVQGQLSGGRTSGDDSRKVTATGIRSDKIVWVEGNESHMPNISRVVKKMDSILTAFSLSQSKLCISGRTKAMVACYPGNGTYYRRHVDNPNKDGRVITCILYLNKDWDVKDGGLLRIFDENGDDYHDVAPLFNRLLFFWSDSRNPHEVQPSHRSRYAITVWYFDKEERQKAKDEEKAQEMFKLGSEEVVKDLEKMKIEKKQIADKIEDEAVKAVQSLSQGELNAIADVIRDHPKPKEVLSSLGISTKIQDILIKQLNLSKS
ncbi:hypothetical protein FSP39_008072 [Pinctada imbricata]|uniref:hypoxia-inducible factor-proline dioxygenase n=1 Tax=Pinctada imbricata TaxID=66713 RepID=A0AA89BJ15_PINIB|nr:hypothetical protein FSP39_008072 [Pinctada imbricata]